MIMSEQIQLGFHKRNRFNLVGSEKMKCKSLVIIMLILVWPMVSWAQEQTLNGDIQAPLLTLDEAISLALDNNRLVKNSVLEEEKYDFRVSTVRSRRLPHFSFDVLGGALLHPFNYTFDQGVFGTYPGVGPIPGTETKIKSPAVFTTHTTAGIDQPLLQQYKIGLGIRVAELGRDIAREDVRAEQQKVTAQVQEAYFNIVASQASVDATREAVRTLEEAQRVTTEYHVQQVALKADLLEVDAALATARHKLLQSENALATQRENLNELLARDLNTQFRVDPTPEKYTTGLTLETARQKAQVNRPENRQAHLKAKQAEFDRRLAKAEYIPDLSISVRYLGIGNVEVLPEHVATAGFWFSWEPFDWGRRHNNVMEKTKTVEQTRNGVAETQSQIALEVGMKYRKWQETLLQLQASRTTHEAAEEQLRVVSNKYNEQAALLKDFLQAEARSSETIFQYQQALSSYWSALADLRKAMGE
jgi:outer membrane protein TolC